VRLARDRACVVDIGKTRLDLPWNDYYNKELDVRFSRSYGPGRYDSSYELDGIDYPAGYVRWTERRNLACFLDLIAGGDIEVQSLVSGVFPLDNASSVYSDLASGALSAVGVLLEYPAPAEGIQRPAVQRPVSVPRVTSEAGSSRGVVSVGFVGAGNYASSMLLPHLAKLGTVRLAHVATNRSLSAVNAQRKFGFATASTTADAVLEDASLDAIFIVTRHHTHADFVCRALETGKAVFVEKPLALNREELQRITDTIKATGNDRLMVGFNRRFAPLLRELKDGFGPAGDGSLARYLVSAGQLDADSWYLNEELEGSRFLGEGGHFIDTLSWWLDSVPDEVYALAGLGPSDLQVTIRFANRSTATVTYLTVGNSRFPKETLDAAGGGRSARLDNFSKAAVWTGRKQNKLKARGGQDKGQRDQVSQFVDAVRTGGAMPISVESLVATTAATIGVGESLLSGKPVQV
jgi:predicted dehydrogenase